MTFSGHSFTTFTNNRADRGGAAAIFESNIIIEEYSTVTFYNNVALHSSGGAFVCSNNSNITFKGSSNVTFNGNTAGQNGGAIYSYNICHMIIKENATSRFVDNNARNNGGAMLNNQYTEITFKGNSVVTFDSNTANNGGAFYCTKAAITFEETSLVSFYNNKALQNGGAISANNYSNITSADNSTLLFISNDATQTGGAGYLYSYSNFIINENATLQYDNNQALNGGGICISDNANLIFKGHSTALYSSNLAIVRGGALQVMNNSSVTLKGNIAINMTNNRAQYGGAVYVRATAMLVNSTTNDNSINFKYNSAIFRGNSVYQDVTGPCNRSCLNKRILGISNELIAAPPNELKFYNPAMYINTDNDTQCNIYCVQRIMLGTKIIIPACVLDYYNQPFDSTQFLVNSEMHQNYFVTGPKQILIGCTALEGISITGNKVLSTSTHFSVNITLNVDHDANWKQISVTLLLELSPCQHGFWQYPESEKCECYNANDIAFCSGSNSTIKRGYWFGSVTGKPTVTFCPINYCNFTCCETSNGYYHLSPVRDNQCKSHRSGTACGSCTHGYTLSFDSTECVNVDSCTAGQTVLVIMLTVIYWVIMISVIFVMMYYRVRIGYLYSITYYYSIVDILLSQNLYASKGVYLTASIISSSSKIMPQFLGELCLTAGMSGIDQQFIHYIHPSAVIVIILVISFLARISRRISAIISRGIVRVICLLLLLSYTSLASTSLLLMRSLTFHDIDKVYTYLSPDIEYFHGRHLAYGIVALLCIASIIFGLPLLLTLEPFLNSKINFVRIKPLLDQFQGCYKDKCHCFASYNMICQLVIIGIVIASSYNEFVANYMLIITCAIIALIQVLVRPYNNDTLNQFDNIILQLIIFITALPLLDGFDSTMIITTAFVLIILPIIIFFSVTLLLLRDDLKKFIINCTSKKESANGVNNDDNNEVPMKQFDTIIDDSVRVNATVCDM